MELLGAVILGAMPTAVGIFAFFFILFNLLSFMQDKFGNKSLFGLIIIVLTIPIAPLVLDKLPSSSSSSSSSGSSKTLQNGEIPGYSTCVERMMRTNPSAKQRVCCDKLGGSWSQTGSFGTCRK